MARILVLTASMGAGHDGVAAEIARRLRDLGHHVDVVDMLTLYPWRFGDALRLGYGTMLRATPWLYESIYQTFFVGRRHANVSPAVSFALPQLRRVVAERRPDAVVSTFHLASLATGRLRRSGELAAPSMVFVTEAAAHDLWRGPGTDLYLCAYPAQAAQLERELGVKARWTGPVVRAQFRPCRDSLPVRPPLLSETDRKVVLVSTGSWGVGCPERVAAALFATGRYLPVVLCGRNARLARRLQGRTDCIALGWVTELTELMRSAQALVENAGGGLTCWEAFAAGVPVVSFDPLPGHGRAGATQLADAGLIRLAADEADLLIALDDVTEPGSPARERLRQATSTLFQADVAAVIVAEAQAFGRPGRQPASGRAGSAD